MFGAILIYLLATAAVLAAELWLEKLAGGTPAEYLIERVVVPALRVAAIVMLMLAAYPSIYGLDEAPALSRVVFDNPGRLDMLVTWTFVFSLLLPQVPVIGKQESLVLPLQAVFAGSMLFAWTTAAMAVDAPLFPSLLTFGKVVLIAVVGDLIGRVVRDRWLRGEAGYVRVTLYDASVLLFQLPAVMVWCEALGAGLPAG